LYERRSTVESTSLTVCRPLLPYAHNNKSILCQRGPSFVIFNIRALWRTWLNVRVPGCQKLQMTD